MERLRDAYPVCLGLIVHTRWCVNTPLAAARRSVVERSTRRTCRMRHNRRTRHNRRPRGRLDELRLASVNRQEVIAGANVLPPPLLTPLLPPPLVIQTVPR